MTNIAEKSDGGECETLTIPNVTGLTRLDAAIAYANSGFYVLPVKLGKHPGSIVGRDWPELSTRCVDLIDCYWDRDPQPGIAIHTGKSHLIAFDLDADLIPDELAWLHDGVFQSTRGGRGQRGHYVFATDELFVSGDLKTAAGVSVGEIRSGNTVILAQPSPHPKADQGGQYLWITKGAVPPLPDIAREYLRTLGATKAVWSGNIEAPSALVGEALADWTRNRRPKALTGPVNFIRKARSGTRNLTRDALRIAASESRVGFYPFSKAVAAIGAAMLESYTQRGEPEKFSQHEFSRLVANGVGYALSRSRSEILTEATGDYRTGHRNGSGSRFAYRSVRGRFGYSAQKRRR
ncbi:bifunctional DNA primase/polymerase [Mycobacterium riyadhense]|uniref:bifunctional DNA primase/polymerase n=1 Tax=Mycobacterium riyadhense TaxID=486698 RepID=UPI00195E809D|nr:bifunctional DNA primase/polymerase [Mycobacterium riyadhense]